MKISMLFFFIFLSFLMVFFTCTNDTPFNSNDIPNVTISAFACETIGLDTNIAIADSVPNKVTSISVAAGQTATFLGFIKKEPSVSDLQWRWNFGDSGTSLSKIVEHRYLDTGSYKAVFTVKNSTGNILSAAVLVRVTPVAGAGVRGYAYLQGNVAHNGITIVFAPAIGTDTVVLQTVKNGFFGLSPHFPKGHYAVTYNGKKTGFYKSIYLNDVVIAEGVMNELGSVTLLDEHNPHIINIHPTDTVDSTRTPVVKAAFIDSGSGVAPKTFLLVFNKDTIPDSLVSLSDSAFSWTPPKRLPDGNYSVFTSVKDSAGNATIGVWEFRMDAMKLVAMPNCTVVINTLVSMYGRASNVYSTIVQYKWDFNGDSLWEDSISTADSIISRPWTYTHEGVYNAILYARDDSGMVKVDTAIITVTNRAPVIDLIRPDTTISIFDSVPFYGKAHDTDGTIKEYGWDFNGDGIFEFTNATQITVSHKFDTARIYLVKFRVTDDDGKKSFDSVRVMVLQDAPQIRFVYKDTVIEHGGAVRCSVYIKQQFGTMIVEVDTANKGYFKSMGSLGLAGGKAISFTTGNACLWDSVKLRVTDDDTNVVVQGFNVDIRPQSLTISTIDSTVNTITVKYNQSQETDFVEYRIYRSATNSVDTSAELWATVKSAGTISYSTMPPSYAWAPRYYCLYQKDSEGLWSAGSKVVYGNIVNSPPAVPVITYPVNTGDTMWSDAVLRWTKCVDSNGHQVRYRVLVNYNNTGYSQFKTALQDTFVQLTGYDSLVMRWKVIAYDTLGDSSASSAEMVTFLKAVVKDIGGNIYHYVTIGTQTWLIENLRTTRYNDSTAIPSVTGGAAWETLTTAAYCWYKNDCAAYKNPYGTLYNWYAVNHGKLAPKGWHVPSDTELITLTTFLGGESAAGGKLKETGFSHWLSPNIGATNATGFSALPGGSRDNNGTFNGIGGFGNWWSSTESDAAYSWYRYIGYDNASVYRYDGSKYYGFSVRCVKD